MRAGEEIYAPGTRHNDDGTLIRYSPALQKRYRAEKLQRKQEVRRRRPRGFGFGSGTCRTETRSSRILVGGLLVTRPARLDSPKNHNFPLITRPTGRAARRCWQVRRLAGPDHRSLFPPSFSIRVSRCSPCLFRWGSLLMRCKTTSTTSHAGGPRGHGARSAASAQRDPRTSRVGSERSKG